MATATRRRPRRSKALTKTRKRGRKAAKRKLAAKPAVEMFDLLDRRDRMRFNELDEAYPDKCSLETFLRTGESSAKLGPRNIVHLEECWRVVEVDGGIYSLHSSNSSNVGAYLTQTHRTLEGVVVPSTNKKGLALLVNGDNGGEGQMLIDAFENSDTVELATFSPECVRRLVDDTMEIGEVPRLMSAGRLAVVAFLSDSKVKFTKGEAASYSAWNRKPMKTRGPCPVTPPSPGYTPVESGRGRSWHRSATVLLHDTKEKRSYLIGQDEDTYFGVQLADNPKTIDDAFASLMPAAVRDYKGSVARQGEWFALPVKEKDVPEVTECVCEGNSSTGLVLNRDSDESARHIVHSEDIRVGKDGLVYAESPTLEHENGDHEQMHCSGWVAFHRNTAVKAVSVQGVD